MSPSLPTPETEIRLAREAGPGPRVIVGLDEVGRGALAGPVAVGACALRIENGIVPSMPEGIRDSKALTARRREALIDPIRTAAHAHAVGWASAEEIDRIGIMAALTTASVRALDGLGVSVDAILLDGNVDVLSASLSSSGRPAPRVVTREKADRDCLSVAAASVLAKVARDELLTALHQEAPDYGWVSNKGYASAVHRAAIDELGPHPQHRRSWRLGSAPQPARTGVLWSDTTAQGEEERQ